MKKMRRFSVSLHSDPSISGYYGMVWRVWFDVGHEPFPTSLYTFLLGATDPENALDVRQMTTSPLINSSKVNSFNRNYTGLCFVTC